MRSRHGLRVATFTLLLGAVFTSADVAAAEELRYRDAAGDVVRIVDGGPPIATPRVKDPDIRRVRMVHGVRAVTIVVHLRQMRRMELKELVGRDWKGRIRTDEHLFGFGGGFRDDGADWTTVHLKGQRVCASNKMLTFDFADSFMTFRFPRSCLGDPTWVRAGLKTARHSNRSWNRVFVDDPLATGAPANATDPVTLCRRLHQG